MEKTREKCRSCGIDLLEPRYPYDNGYCRKCYKNNKNKKLLQEGDMCLKCGGIIKNRGIWEDKTKMKMIGRVIICPACEHLYRRAGETEDQ
jgi:hypothetical protein